MRPIDQKKPTTRHIDNASINQRPRSLGVVHELVMSLVAKLLRQSGQCIPRIFMVLGLLEPFPAEEMVGTCALTDGARETRCVRVRDADCVVAACAESPG